MALYCAMHPALSPSPSAVALYAPGVPAVLALCPDASLLPWTHSFLFCPLTTLGSCLCSFPFPCVLDVPPLSLSSMLLGDLGSREWLCLGLNSSSAT